MRFLFIVILYGIILNAQNWEQLQKIAAGDREENDYFGYSVAIDGDYAIVGAYTEDENENGTDSLTDAGSAYIYFNDSGNWVELQKIVASDRSRGDNFGCSVAISGDYAIVGAKYEDEDEEGLNTMLFAGSAYIFHNNNGTWEEVQKIVASDRSTTDNFGRSVAIDGDYLIVGSNNEYDAYGFFVKSGAGAAYIFENNMGTWEEVQKVTASQRNNDDQFSNSVAISGNYAVIGAYLEDEDANNNYTMNNSGTAYIFKRSSGGFWSQSRKLVASDRADMDRFGLSVAIDSNYILVGAFAEDEDETGINTMADAGSAYIFKYNPDESGDWDQIKKIVASDRNEGDNFGNAVAISGNYIAIGARTEDDDENDNNYLSNSGSVYFYKNNSDNWNEVKKVVASDRAEEDYFAYCVDISGDNAIIGARYEDEDETGSNTLDYAGSAYIITDNGETPVELTSFNAVVSDETVELKWETATEVNNYGFAVERSTVKGEWSKIGFVEGAGNSNVAKSYSFSENLTHTLTSPINNTSGQAYSYRLKQIDLDGMFSYSKEIEVKVENVPSEFVLEQNYPNPFNPVTTIKYSIPTIGARSIVPVRLKIFNLLGQEVATLVNKQQPAGNYQVKFDGSSLASGIYLYKLQAGDFSSVKKLILMK